MEPFFILNWFSCTFTDNFKVQRQAPGLYLGILSQPVILQKFMYLAFPSTIRLENVFSGCILIPDMVIPLEELLMSFMVGILHHYANVLQAQEYNLPWTLKYLQV